MKKFTTTLAAIVLLQIISFANNDTDSKTILVSANKVEVSMAAELSSRMVVASSFDVDDNQVEIEFKSDVESVEIYDHTGELVFVVPVLSNEFNLGLGLFEKGEYKIGFKFDGEADVQLADMAVKI